MIWYKLHFSGYQNLIDFSEEFVGLGGLIIFVALILTYMLNQENFKNTSMDWIAYYNIYKPDLPLQLDGITDTLNVNETYLSFLSISKNPVIFPIFTLF